MVVLEAKDAEAEVADPTYLERARDADADGEGDVGLERAPTSKDTRMGDKLNRIQRLRYMQKTGWVLLCVSLSLPSSGETGVRKD